MRSPSELEVKDTGDASTWETKTGRPKVGLLCSKIASQEKKELKRKNAREKKCLIIFAYSFNYAHFYWFNFKLLYSTLHIIYKH